MSFRVNDSPLAGTEGDKVTSRVIRDRLLREAEGNVALKIEESADKDSFYVVRPWRIAARRADRDHAPRRLRACRVAPARRDAEGRERQLLEPIEEVVIDVDEEHAGVVVRRCPSARRDGRHAPSGGPPAPGVPRADPRPDRLPVELLTDTRGTAMMNRLFHAYQPYKGEMPGRTTGVLISNEQGERSPIAHVEPRRSRPDDHRRRREGLWA
jgi:GTP-binding protein